MGVLTRLLVTAALALALPAGCYNPNIQDGGLICAATDGGLRCPDGFKCNTVDNHCYRSGGSCAQAAPLCQDAPRAGSACSPACQIGCQCGRCNVSGLDAICAPFIGPKKLGEVCASDRDDCGPGLICLLEACGDRLARCYRHCNSAAQCTGGAACETPILTSAGADTGFLTCDLAPQDCDPTAATAAATGCPNAALGCYVGPAGAAFCDCPAGALHENDACNAFNDCAPGLTCASGSGVSGRRCRPVCLVANPTTCASAQQCVGNGGKYGFCRG
jgi:hypothetical protein